MSRPLNVLWLVTDQQTASAMSCAGNRWLRTPGMDRIAKRGTRFERAYCTYPLCTPSRGSLLTGQYPHQIDCDSNTPGKGGQFFWYRDFPREHLLTHHLSTHGYRCVWAGKDMPPEDGSCGVDLLCPWGDSAVGDSLVKFLKGPHDKPFLAVGAFVNPHNICEWARQCTLYEGDVGTPPPLDELPPLPANHDIAPNEPEMIRLVQKENVYTGYHVRGVSDEEWRQYIWAFARMVEMVDREVVRILDALDQAGLADNTLVIFTSDHGDGCASHKWNQKCALYEEIIRVPLMLAGPGIAAGRVDTEHLVSNGLDTFPTVCEAAGLPVPGHVEGKSLLQLCRGGKQQTGEDWRDALVIETALPSELPGVNPLKNAGRSVVTRDLKYSVYRWARHREQLVNLASDPGEMRNLAGDPASRDTLMAMRQRLQGWAQAAGDTFEPPGCEIVSPQAGRNEQESIRRKKR